METIQVPRRDAPFALNLPAVPQQPLSPFGKAVEWIRSFEDRGIIARVSMYVVLIFTSWLLICSVVGLPLFILAHREFVCQRERNRYGAYCQKLLQTAKENNRIMFINARQAPLDHINLCLSYRVREQAIKDLGLKRDEAVKMTDGDIIRRMADQFDDYLARCGLA